MITYVFSEEIYKEEHRKKPKGKGVWVFGDRNKEVTVTVGVEKPLTYKKAKLAAAAELEKQRYLMYKTIYLHP